MANFGGTDEENPGSPFHRGERAVQQRLGVAERVAPLGRQSLRDVMPDQHREFFAQLPFILVGTRDGNGQSWASALCGPPGFARASDPRRLEVQALPLPGDPLHDTLHAGVPIGLLGIEPHTRRRNRMNGIVEDVGPGGFAVRVVQSFGNCPKYIQARHAQYDAEFARARPSSAVENCAVLDVGMRAMIAAADTLYIASAFVGDEATATAACGADVSHRGGRAGFVRCVNERTLLMPDFAGNNLYNTLGNLLIEPRGGLLFMDFENGDLLYVAVQTEILWDGPDVEAYRGAQRALRFEVLAARRVTRVLPLRWGEAALSPFLERTGDWRE
ncbi:MAG: pyridoxamine 5'-phosphate oxidase family protein [Gammaproteobacteria bacterium]|nr:pyridoxamine 5'-phosphate oxidase family protein [Gammaproteobacteria bacterium]